jgi:predicted nuclease with TOPRIM domain
VEELDRKVKQLSVENERLKSDSGKLRAQIRVLQTSVTELSAGIEILSNQIIALGHKPKWTRKRPTSE